MILGHGVLGWRRGAADLKTTIPEVKSGTRCDMIKPIRFGPRFRGLCSRSGCLGHGAPQAIRPRCSSSCHAMAADDRKFQRIIRTEDSTASTQASGDLHDQKGFPSGTLENPGAYRSKSAYPLFGAHAPSRHFPGQGQVGEMRSSGPDIQGRISQDDRRIILAYRAHIGKAPPNLKHLSSGNEACPGGKARTGLLP